MKKLLLSALLGIMLISTFAVAEDFATATPGDAVKADLIIDATCAKPKLIPTSTNSGYGRMAGNGYSCKTTWAWDGKSWIKRDLMKDNGKMIKGFRCVAVQEDNYKRSADKPTMPGKRIDSAPWPQHWYSK